MSNELTNTNSRAVADVGDPFGAQGSEGASGNVTYVKFTGATGLFTAGKDDDVIEHGTRFVANMMESGWVWAFWWDNEVLEQFTDRLVDNPMSYDNPPMNLPEDPDGVINMSIEEIMQAQKDDPANFRDGWGVQATLDLMPVDGSGEQHTIKLNKGVAMNAFHTLRKSFGNQYKLKAGLKPVVELNANSYEPRAKSAGKKRWAPVLKIVDWVSEEDMAAMVGDDPSLYEDQDGGTDTTTEGTAAPDTADTPPAQTRGRRGARGNNLG